MHKIIFRDNWEDIVIGIDKETLEKIVNKKETNWDINLMIKWEVFQFEAKLLNLVN